MITDLMELTNLTQTTLTILSCSAYARHDLDDTCYLKSADAGRSMKSECVTPKSPESVPYDWMMKNMMEEE